MDTMTAYITCVNFLYSYQYTEDHCHATFDSVANILLAMAFKYANMHIVTVHVNEN